MELSTLFNIVAVAIAIGAVWSITAAFWRSRWTRIVCPECGFTIAYRGVSAAEACRLRQHMQNHVASHNAEGAPS
ncbi:hypothetical protein [Streptomyces sp. NPDC057686]|uniref:hypothetical protein n=1 Tax=Streptomyces sp. NPDC057686 TaxID=3346212 RepID=UPI0036778228